ncbi:MAG: peptidase M3 [Deltaproteobacteria bacterium]|nr:peptidase M3 [Deltaproteobacteria bacterium]
MSTSVAALLEGFAERYLELHTHKEDLFWVVKMGLAPDPHRAGRELAEAEIALNRYLQDPANLATLRGATSGATAAERRVLEGWIAVFAAHAIESPDARKLSEQIVERESELEHARGTMKLGYTDPTTGAFVPASSVKLGLVMRTHPEEAMRKAAFEGLRSIERFVLDHGFLEIVSMRNRLGRMLGHEDYYAWKVAVVERMEKTRLFEVLDDLAARTAERTRAQIDAFAAQHGPGSLDPWNFPYLRTGTIQKEIDPYFSFGQALSRWGRSFAALGVRYRGATLTLDLVDRPGKYENGFMHGPGPAFFDRGTWRPARINFTANAVPGAVGSGLRAAETLFHEGGHAAHFANILQDSPCFSQEFAPTSVAYAETQSMFMDSLLSDADWRVRYARDASGHAMPVSLIERCIREEQPLRPWDVRAMLTVVLGERALYEIPDAELGPERVLATFRDVERRTQFLSSGVRPVLAVPHLLSGEASAYYHGYVLALMAVEQTRAFFLARDGYLTDNPRVGPDVAEHYWKPGNSVPFDEVLRSLTGNPLSADALVAACNRTTDDAVAAARASVARVERAGGFDGPVELDATVRVVHGKDTIADTAEHGWDGACSAFERWLDDATRTDAAA